MTQCSQPCHTRAAVWRATFLLCTLALSACVPNDQDVQKELASAVADINGSIAPLPAFKPYTATPYTQRLMADPFGPAKAQIAGRLGGKTSVGRPDESRPRQALEAFPLEALEFNGFLVERGIVHAMVTFADTLYTVKTGDYMGQNFGRVLKITDSDVLLVEKIQESSGEWIERENRLAVGVSGKKYP